LSQGGKKIAHISQAAELGENHKTRGEGKPKKSQGREVWEKDLGRVLRNTGPHAPLLLECLRMGGGLSDTENTSAKEMGRQTHRREKKRKRGRKKKIDLVYKTATHVRGIQVGADLESSRMQGSKNAGPKEKFGQEVPGKNSMGQLIIPGQGMRK